MLSLWSKFDHIMSFLKEQPWFPVKQKTEYKVLLLMYKALYAKAPA